MRYQDNKHENKRIKDKLYLAAFILPPFLLFMWLNENDFFGVFG